MNVTIFGIGYVGLVQAAVFADAGHDVCCVDSDFDKIDGLKKGEMCIHEPGLADLVQKNLSEGRLKFTTNAEEGVHFSKVQFIAVGTPPDEDGSADLKHVLQVAESIAHYMDTNKLIVNKSTVPVGTADMVIDIVSEILKSRKSSLSFSVISNPEFLKEGSAVGDCKRPNRIIIGTNSIDSEEIMRELYEPFNRNHEKIIVMDIRSAELTKYAANCMLATKISFMNEMANIAEHVGANIESVRHGIGSDPRIGYQFIYPGCGYGGSCFPKDVKALVHSAQSMGYAPQILKAVESVNYTQKNKLFEYISSHFKLSENEDAIREKTFAIWGLSFKPNTNDMRDAPSRVLMESLWASGAKVQAFDPSAMEEAQRIYFEQRNLMLMGTKESALKGADALIICTDWQNFKAPDFNLIKSELSSPVVFDGRNLYDPIRMNKNGITYYSIGRIGLL